MEHSFGISDSSYDLLTQNKKLAYILCGDNLISTQEFSNKDLIEKPDMLAQWKDTILEAHKKDCPHLTDTLIEEACLHTQEEQSYEIIVRNGFEDRKWHSCKNCIGEYIFRASARGPLIVQRE